MVNMIATYKASGIAAASHTDAAAKAMTEMLGRTWEPRWIAKPKIYGGRMTEITFARCACGMIRQMYQIECIWTDGAYSVEIFYVPGYDVNEAHEMREVRAKYAQTMEAAA